MKWLIPAVVALGSLSLAPDATAQCVADGAAYAAPVRVVASRPLVAAPPAALHVPPASVVYRPASVAYRPAAVVHRPAAVVHRPAVAAPVLYGRPAYMFYSPYGGREIRVPGQPILNALRTIVP